MIKEIIVRKTGSGNVLATEAIQSDSMLTIGSSVSSSIYIEELAPEQLVLVYEDGIPYLLNRGKSVTVNGEALSSGGKTIVGEETILTVFDYEISFRDEPEEHVAEVDSIPGNDFFFVTGGNLRKRFYPVAESMWFGQIGGSFEFSRVKSSLDEVFCRIGFDWSGATIFPRTSEKTKLNGRILIDPTLLRQGDKVTFLGTGLNVPVLCSYNLETTEEPIDADGKESASDKVAEVSEPLIDEIDGKPLFSALEIALLAIGMLIALIVGILLYSTV